jgi:hypothetical protein
MKNLIGISGKINSGKDTLGKIIQYIICIEKGTLAEDQKDLSSFFIAPVSNELQSGWKLKKFADKLKDCVCLLIGCTRQQLEDRNFKEKELGEEWWYISKPEIDMFIPYTEDNWAAHGDFEENLVMLTPRKLLQLLGTEAGRNIIHPNIWVNATFADYKSAGEKIGFKSYSKRDMEEGFGKKPNWLFTDMRFPNELEAIKSRGGITIRINRPYRPFDESRQTVDDVQMTPEHPSETALDDAKFDYVINNEGTIEDLIDKAREILKLENII